MSLHRHGFLVLPVAWLLSGCDSADRTPVLDDAPAATLPAAAASDVSCVDIAEHGLAFDAAAREGLRAQIGEPISIDTTISHGHGPARDSLFLVRYPGLTLSVRRPAGGSEIIDAARVADNRYLRYPQAGIGTAVDQVIRLIGAPAENTVEQLTYVCHSHPANDDPVTFRLANGRVSEIVFTYYMD